MPNVDIELEDNKQFISNIPHNFDPLKPHFYTVKLGFTGYTLFFLFLLKNVDCVYSLEPPQQGGSKEYPHSTFWAEIWKISNFLSENFQILVVIFSIYLNRRVFVMWDKGFFPVWILTTGLIFFIHNLILPLPDVIIWIKNICMHSNCPKSLYTNYFDKMTWIQCRPWSECPVWLELTLFDMPLSILWNKRVKKKKKKFSIKVWNKVLEILGHFLFVSIAVKLYLCCCKTDTADRVTY